MTPIRVLMLVGATTTPEMDQLSRLYARGAVHALAADPRFCVALLHTAPDGTWRLPAALDTLDAAPALTFADALAALPDFDVGLPQMFCAAGMTTHRALFALLGRPFIGNTPLAMAQTADKTLARTLVSAAGVNVPPGTRVAPGQLLPDSFTDPALTYPVIVKPAASDNSEGLSLVTDASGLASALARAHTYGDALVERFIPPGRELRVGVIARGGDPLPLPPEEYPVGPAHPIRSKTDKLARNASGALVLAAKSQTAAWIVDADDPAIPALHAAALAAYRALGCRHYGLFDFRVDDAGTPWFLEAGLYCSFSPDSVVCAMARAIGLSPADLLADLIDQNGMA